MHKVEAEAETPTQPTHAQTHTHMHTHTHLHISGMHRYTQRSLLQLVLQEFPDNYSQRWSKQQRWCTGQLFGGNTASYSQRRLRPVLNYSIFPGNGIFLRVHGANAEEISQTPSLRRWRCLEMIKTREDGGADVVSVSRGTPGDGCSWVRLLVCRLKTPITSWAHTLLANIVSFTGDNVWY